MDITTIMYIVSIGISLILLGFIIYGVRSGPSKEELKSDPVIIPNDKDEKKRDREISIGELRHYGDINLESGEAAYFITEGAREALGIYLSITPTIVEVLMKAAKIMDELNSMIETGSIDTSEITLKIQAMIQMITPLITVADRLNTQIYDACQSSKNESEQVELSEEIVFGYITNSTTMFRYTMDYLQMINIMKSRIEKRGGSYISRFNTLNNEFIHIFFIGILNCTFMLDETIRVIN